MLKERWHLADVRNNKITMKKVLFFINSNGVGGAERMTITLAKLLDKNQFLPVFVLVGKEDRISQFIPKDFRIENIKVRNVYDFLLLKIYNCIKSEKPDVVFSSQVFLNVRLISIARLIGGIKVIVRHPSSLAFIKGINRLFMNQTYKYAHTIVAQQEEMAGELMSLPGVRAECVKVLHNPIDVDTIHEKLNNMVSPYTNIFGSKFVNVGSIYPAKGQDILLKAFLQVHCSLPESHLFLVGRIADKDFYQNLVSYIECNNLNDYVHFVGYTDNPYQWMKYSDCFVLSSRTEGLPNALIEASYLNVPVVSTLCIPIVKRIIEPCVNGFIVPIDGVDAMAEAMIDACKMKTVTMTYNPASSDEINTVFVAEFDGKMC